MQYIIKHGSNNLLLQLSLFHTFSVLVANPKKLLYTVANPARGLLNRGKKTSGSAPPICSFGEKLKVMRHIYMYVSRGATQVGVTQISVRLASVHKDSFDSSARPMGVASQNSMLPCAITTFPISLPLSSPPVDVWPRLSLLFVQWQQFSSQLPRAKCG